MFTLPIRVKSSGFVDCCGLNIFYNLHTTNSVNEPIELNEAEKEMIGASGKGASLIALSHGQWSEEMFKTLKDLGYKPILSDFYNSSSGNKVTLFAKVHHPNNKGNGALWGTLKWIFGR